MRDTEKGNFKSKLESIHKVLCQYIDERAANEHIRHVADAKLRYSIILLAVYDLHHGTLENQADAIAYFKSDNFIRHKDECLVPEDILNKIIHDVGNYATYITYPKDVEDNWSWMDSI